MTDARAAEIAGKAGSTDPDFINAAGVKWWRDRNTYCHHELRGKVNLWLVIEPNGNASRVITDATQILYESQSLEAIGCRLDMMKTFPDVFLKGPQP